MTPDPLPWRHETGSRHANDYDAPAGVVFWMPRDNEKPHETGAERDD